MASKKQRLSFEPGDKINNFQIVRRIRGSENQFIAQCQCGKEMRASAWVFKSRKSCGCLTGKLISAAISKRNKGLQGNYTQMYPTEYKSYSGMLRRCTDKKDVNWHNYGGRGIKVCPRWKKGEKGQTGFQCFIEDMGPKPFNEYSLDREDGDKDYSPDNCRWADKILQANNLRTNIWKRVQKKELSLKQGCKLLNLPYAATKKFVDGGGDLKDMKSMHWSVLGVDPGTRNFAVCHVNGGEVKFSTHFKNLIHEIKTNSLSKLTTAYTKEWSDLLDYAQPDVVIVERFMARQFSAKIIELIGFMLGVLCNLCWEREIRIELISSAQWKTSLKRVGDLDKLYKIGKDKYGLEPHPIDAMCMARYALSYHAFSKEDKLWVSKNLPKLLL